MLLWVVGGVSDGLISHLAAHGVTEELQLGAVTEVDCDAGLDSHLGQPDVERLRLVLVIDGVEVVNEDGTDPGENFHQLRFIQPQPVVRLMPSGMAL